MNKLLTALLAGAVLSLSGLATAAHHEGDSQSRDSSDSQTQAQPQTQGNDASATTDESTGRAPQAEANDPELFAKLKKCDEESLNDEQLRKCIQKAKNQGNEM